MSWIQSLLVHARMILFSLCAICALSAGGHAATTLENLRAAFNGEKNAQARYLAFAQRADSEGYGEMASLFRAAALSEEIHAENHAAVLKEIGGNFQVQLETLTVRSTRENLAMAIEDESYERGTMYPEFIEQAKSEGNLRAIVSLGYAKSAEAGHEKLFADALANIDRLKGSASAISYVCSTCGLISRETNLSKCSHCFTSGSAFETVS